MSPLIERFFTDADHPFTRSSSEVMASMRKWILSLSFILYLVENEKFAIKSVSIPGVELKVPTAHDVEFYLFVVCGFLVLQYILYAMSYTFNEFALFLAKRRSELFFDNLSGFINADESLKEKLAALNRAKDPISKDLQEFKEDYVNALNLDRIRKLEASLRDRALDELFHFVGAEFRLSRRKVIMGTIPLILVDAIKTYACVGFFAIVAINAFFS